jgi:hypothetical protein
MAKRYTLHIRTLTAAVAVPSMHVPSTTLTRLLQQPLTPLPVEAAATTSPLTILMSFSLTAQHGLTGNDNNDATSRSSADVSMPVGEPLAIVHTLPQLLLPVAASGTEAVLPVPASIDPDGVARLLETLEPARGKQ